MLDMYVFESNQLLEQLEQIIISCEKTNSLDTAIDEIFRIMHTIKGNSSMMLFSTISEIAHSVEDLFFILRERTTKNINTTELIDIILEVLDFIKVEVAKIEQLVEPDGKNTKLVRKIKAIIESLKSDDSDNKEILNNGVELDSDKKYYVSSKIDNNLDKNKNYYEINIKFLPECLMENIRAFQIIHSLKYKVNVISYNPEDLFGDNGDAAKVIQKNGFKIVIGCDLSLIEINNLFNEEVFLEEVIIKSAKLPYISSKSIDLEMPLVETNDESNIKDEGNENTDQLSADSNKPKNPIKSMPKQNFISVSVPKLDVLMDLVGEMVITEAMVINNPDLENLELNNFNRASRQLKKITTELQDVVMSIRMVALSMTFQKMNRLVRDMSVKLNKKVKLDIIGEETEVDKNIIEQISDPLMHLIRNSIDHGIEPAEIRRDNNKPEIATITLEALNSSGDVYIMVKDDGAGLDKNKILKRAQENNLINKPVNELTDKEIYQFILLPGFSTKSSITEYSGRGVGMDVVSKNIEKIGGTITIDSTPDKGTSITIKIPLTLAIIDGIGIKIGEAIYTVPIMFIKESFKISENDIIRDLNGDEMILIRGNCLKIIRLHNLFNISTDVTDISQGVVMVLENNDTSLCIFCDELIGEQQVVVKPLPAYIKKINWISGCTILGDGNISLILDVAAMCKSN